MPMKAAEIPKICLDKDIRSIETYLPLKVNVNGLNTEE